MKSTRAKVAAVTAAALAFVSAAYADNQCVPAFNSQIATGTVVRSEIAHNLIGHTPRVIKAMNDSGKMADDQVLTVAVALKLNNESELDQRIEEMYRAGSPSFHQFITPAEFVSKYAPTAAQIAQEKAFLESKGITVTGMSANNVFIKASGTVSALNAAFKTEVHTFRHQNGKQYFAPKFDLSTPVESRITAVVGLTNTAEFHNHLRLGAMAAKAPKKQGTAPSGGFGPTDIRSAYNIPNNLDGSGQTLALFELDGYKAANITKYTKQFSLATPKLTNVLVGGFSGKPSDGEPEVELDIELMIALAPKATEIIVYEGANSEEGLIDTYTRIASDNKAPQISTSWGLAESNASSADEQSENTIFKQMVAQGQTLFSAAGDSGAKDDGSTVGADDPSAQPYVVAVGGTKLVTDGNFNWQSETTWNELSVNEGAGGGGISTVWTIPSWQASAISKANTQGSKTMRNTPDVALNADPETGYGVYITDPQSRRTLWAPIGGTSAAAPLWAAFNALVNQNRAAKGLSNTGFLNPALYALGAGKTYNADFHDIADGSSNGAGTDGFKTVKGFDNSTGWGSFQGTNLLNDLSSN